MANATTFSVQTHKTRLLLSHAVNFCSFCKFVREIQTDSFDAKKFVFLFSQGAELALKLSTPSPSVKLRSIYSIKTILQCTQSVNVRHVLFRENFHKSLNTVKQNNNSSNRERAHGNRASNSINILSHSKRKMAHIYFYGQYFALRNKHNNQHFLNFSSIKVMHIQE